MRIVLDTSVLVAALRSRDGASFALLRQVGPAAPFRLCLSVPLALEYESAVKRQTGLNEGDAERLVDYLCAVADLREIHFLWRPFLRDPSDEMVLEVGVEANAEVIVTHNVRDFGGVEKAFGIRVVRPGEFLLELEGEKR